MAARPSSRQQLHGRQSVAVGSLSRQSMAPGALAMNQAPTSVQYDENGEVIFSPAQQRVQDKQSEWDGFLKLLKQTEVQQQYMSEMGEKTDLLGDGANVVSKVIANWQNVFRATHLALASLTAQERRGVPPDDVQVPTLVRIPTSAAARKERESHHTT